MENVVTFPGLGLSFEVPRVAFSLFGFNVYWYGVVIGFGMLLAVLFALRVAPQFGVDPDRLLDAAIISVLVGVVGARVYFLLFISEREYTSLWDMINLRDGGLGIYGGIILGLVSGYVCCRVFKIALLPAFDIAGMSFLIGQGIGRWGNYFNQEAFGSNTTLPWGMQSAATTAFLQNHQASLAAQGIIVDPGAPVHPTFLYESIWCLLGFVLLFLYRKHRKFNGEMFLFYVIWYGFGRFFIEGLRTDSLMFLGLRVSQLVAVLSVVGGLAVWAVARWKTRGKPLVIPSYTPRQPKPKRGDKAAVEQAEEAPAGKTPAAAEEADDGPAAVD